MALKVDYVLKETGRNLWRNFTLTLATTITIAVTLTLVGAALLLRYGVDNANRQWRDGVEFIVFMEAEAAPEQIAAVQSGLEESPAVLRYTYLDKDAAYNEFLELFEDSPEIVESVTPDALPTNFKVVPVDADDDVILSLSDQFERRAGVREVVSAPETIAQMQDFFGVVSWLVVGGGTFLGVAALVLITNTIRTAMYARRREIEVMKLVGATNWFIRMPFMGEGLIQGLIGGLLGVGGIYLLNYLMDSRLSKTFGFLRNFLVESGDVLAASAVVLAAGCLVGILGSAIAVTRFLDV